MQNIVLGLKEGKGIYFEPEVGSCVPRTWTSVALSFKMYVGRGTQTFIITEQRDVINQCIYQIYWWGYQVGTL